MKNLFTLLFSVFTVVASVGQADSVTNDNYWLVEAQQVSFGEDATFSGEDEISMPSVNFAFGHRFNRFLSVEANMYWWMVNHHIASEELEDGTELGVDKGQGLSMRLDFPIYKKVSGFSQLSYNFIHLHVVGSGNQHDDGIGYSAGLGYKVKKGDIYLRYAVLLDNENDDPKEISFEDLNAIGIGYKLDLEF